MEEDDDYEVPRAIVDRGDPEVMEDQRHGDGASITDSEVSVESSRLRRSARASKPVDRYQGHQKQVTFADNPAVRKKLEEAYNIAWKPGSKKTSEYGLNAAQVAAKFMVETHDQVIIAGASYAQQYLLKKGLQKFGMKGSDAITKELDQLHKRNCFALVDVSKLTVGKRRRQSTHWCS
jgi:hypothetical protein